MILPVVLALAAAALPALGVQVVPPGPSGDQFVFAGCSRSDPAGWWVGTHLTTLRNLYKTYQECADSIIQARTHMGLPEWAYVYWWPGDPMNPSYICGHGKFPPKLNELVSPNADGTCPDKTSYVGVIKDYEIDTSKFSYQFSGCYAGVTQTVPPVYAGNFLNGDPGNPPWHSILPGSLNVYDCLIGCAGEFRGLQQTAGFVSEVQGWALHYADGAPEIEVHGSNCICATGEVYGTPNTCHLYDNPGPFGLEGPPVRKRAPYTQTRVYAAAVPLPLVEPSDSPERRRHARAKQLALQMAREHAFCPPGLTACHVSEDGAGAGYECLDVTSELESCGGCRYGEYASNATAPTGAVGTDCTALRGVDAAATSCLRGECIASKCHRGYRLAGKRCVRA